MLLLIDLDNTLVDRRAAYKAWAESRFGESEVPWLIEADRDGYERRETLAAKIVARYGGDERPTSPTARRSPAGPARRRSER